jgi:transcriptional regulator with XRE-family HTH domain
VPTATINPEAERRLKLQAKRIRMARAAADLSLHDLAELVSNQLGQSVSYEMIRRIERGQRDVEYALLRAIATVLGPAIVEETETPLGWLAGGGEPVFVNPGYLKPRWHQFVIPWDDGEPSLFAVAS